MAELLTILNPKRRRRHKGAKGRKHKGAAKRAGRIAVSPGGAAVTFRANPRRRHRRHKTHFFGNPRRRHYRRNPAFRMPTGKAVINQLTDAAVGAAGATVIDIAMGFVAPRLPATLLTPTVYPIVKSGAAILTGALGASMGGQMGRLLVKGSEGSLITTLRDVIRGLLPAGVALGYISSGYVPPRGMGAYLRGVNTPLMGVQTPLMGLGETDEGEWAPWSPPDPGLRGVSAYLNR
jgi:hypothetical protein